VSVCETCGGTRHVRVPLLGDALGHCPDCVGKRFYPASGEPGDVVVGSMTYSLRKFQSGPGHDWLRKTPGFHKHRSANAEVNQLVDEIVRLRARVEELEGS